MRLPGVVAVALSLACAAGLRAGQARPAAETVEPWREFPLLDSLRPRFRAGVDARQAESERWSKPGAPETIRHLIAVNRNDAAIDGLRLAMRADAETAAAAVKVITAAYGSLVWDMSHGYVERLKEAVAPARERLATLPREDAARLARALVAFDDQYDRLPNNSPSRLRVFVKQYAGTNAALLAEVDLLWSADVRKRIADYDDFWKTHPASEAGAKALYLKGWELHVNVPVTGAEARGADPTNRLMQVFAIVDELERGRYPDCEWVTRAPELVTGFFVSDSPPPVYAEGNVARSLAEYGRFVRTHLGRDAKEDLFDSSVAYTILSRMGALYQLQGDRAGGIERFLDELEAGGQDRHAIELMRGRFRMQQAMNAPADAQPAMARRAEETLTAVARANAGYVSRKAAAELAVFVHYQREYARAVPLYLDYAATYPASPWAWAALVHAGQCLADLGDAVRAAEMFERVAAAYPHEPLAVVMGATLAGRTFDAAGQFDRSLASYRRALAAWDPVYGIDLPSTASLRPVPAPATGVAGSTAITRDGLSDRVAALERHLADRSGTLLERGIVLVGQRQFAPARDVLAQAVQRAGSAPARAEARLWLHRADLEIALDLAAVEGQTRDDAAALKALEAIAREPFDGIVGVAGIARATLLFKLGRTADADAAMQSTLAAWIAAEQPLRTRPPASSLAADLAEVRQIAFQPTGGLALLSGRSWNAFEFPSSIGYAIVRADVRVKMPDGALSRVPVYQELPALPKTIFASSDEITLLTRLIVSLGGTKTRATVDVMETPNQPAGSAVDVMKFWNRHFPTRQGHWGGWVVETYPTVDQVEFLNPERTRAGVAVTVGYSGCTIMMEKTDGHWRATAIVNEWIT